jgi:sec-independent protein translocase protein TatB
MFGFGWGEMVVIGIVALIAIGPKELPTVLRSLGHWVGKIRRMAAEFQGQFQEALREAELTDLKKHAEDIATDVSNFDPMADTQKEMERVFDMPDPMAPVEPPASAESAVAPSSETAKELPEVTALPAIDVTMPELPPPATEKDFAPAVPAPSQEAQKQAGGKA